MPSARPNVTEAASAQASSSPIRSLNALVACMAPDMSVVIVLPCCTYGKLPAVSRPAVCVRPHRQTNLQCLATRRAVLRTDAVMHRTAPYRRHHVIVWAAGVTEGSPW